MLGFLRLSFIGFVVLTIVYVCLSLYSRAVRRDKLEAEWEAEGMQGDDDAKEAFVKSGLTDYDGSLRRKLILGVYVVPVTLIAAVIYFTNFH
ncbi:hypothetical protein Q4577_09100 [Marinovum sp. 2_MG-2023]|uniref:hypothetical protein n=1 Tax=Roseobacteraceae TaxID=2854170 RepID=UPI001FD218A9|nr:MULTISPECIES: hypothetical protein [Roseobacteraceae]MCJ7874213.1 hypothetical protein [Phaeobacter sp. J2-8]MDO6730175.1 hypothetical protein [Marinovum sp. 2_MG-2023]MDO6778913.1 hypothetical protein [Marinovum sp. 1_MG-2023]